MELAALERLKKTPIDLYWENLVDWIFLILAGNKDNYIFTDEFEIRPDPSVECGVSCP